MLAAITWAGGTACAVLLLAGNAVSRATAFAAMDDEFQLDPNTRRLFEGAGLLLLASATLAAILLVGAVSLAALRHGLLPRWLGWAGFPAAALLPLAISFVGFLVLALWVIAISAALAFPGGSARAAPTGATPYPGVPPDQLPLADRGPPELRTTGKNRAKRAP